jgi:hypothetical protein
VFRKILRFLVSLVMLSGSAAFAADCVNGNNAAGNCTVPSGITSINVSLLGGGGGGYPYRVTAGGGRGGGGGGYCAFTLTVTPGMTLAVGSAGTGGAGGSGNGFVGYTAGADGLSASITYSGVAYSAPGGGRGLAGIGGSGGSAFTTCSGTAGAAGDNTGAGGAAGIAGTAGRGGATGTLASTLGEPGSSGYVNLSWGSAPGAPTMVLVPTLSEWALILFGALMAGAMVWYQRRRV